MLQRYLQKKKLPHLLKQRRQQDTQFFKDVHLQLKVNTCTSLY